MSDYQISKVYPSDKRTNRLVSELLIKEGIRKDGNLDYTCAMFDDDMNVIATGSCFGNTLRCMAVDSSHQGEGLMNEIVTHLMEAAYQREVYKLIDAGDSVQAETLSSIMKETLQKFWGDDVEISDDAALTWMRQPHYYMGLYSYTYSAGLTLATQAALNIAAEGESAVARWRAMLEAGSTRDPLGLAAIAGIDLSTPDALEHTIAYISGIIDEIAALTEEIDGITLD